MQRRDFLGCLGGLGLGAGLMALSPQLALAAARPGRYERLLILVELKGGNDGLNTLVPYADPVYRELRPRIGIRREDVLQLDDKAGLHPALQPIMPLWQGGELALIQGVGYPHANLSHFRSIEIWETASSAEQLRNEGWLARTFALAPPPATYTADGVVVGSQEMGPLAGTGLRSIALSNADQFLRQARLAHPASASGGGALAHILKVEGDIAQAANRLAAAPQLMRTEFPRGGFGDTVKTACQVAAAGNGVAALRLTLNGFDTHQNQPGTQTGLLKQLAEGLLALRAGLMELGRWDSTLVLSYGEFGRRAKENQSNGTDHGTASVHFACGGRVKGGLYGATPPLDRLDGNGNLAFSVDFRSLYATALERWWGLPSVEVLGGRFEPLDLLKS